MSSKKLHLAVSTHIQQKTLFPRRILAYSDFLGQTSVELSKVLELSILIPFVISNAINYNRRI